MKPESKKSRGKRGGTSSVDDPKHNETESCYDFSNFSEALDVIVQPPAVNPAESAYDFGGLSKELSTIEHKEKKIAALRLRSQKKKEFLQMRHEFIEAIMCPSPPLIPVMLSPTDASPRPPRCLRNHPVREADVPGEEMKEGGDSQVELERPYPIMYRLSRIVSLGNMRRRRNWRVVAP